MLLLYRSDHQGPNVTCHIKVVLCLYNFITPTLELNQRLRCYLTSLEAPKGQHVGGLKRFLKPVTRKVTTESSEEVIKMFGF